VYNSISVLYCCCDDCSATIHICLMGTTICMFHFFTSCNLILTFGILYVLMVERGSRVAYEFDFVKELYFPSLMFLDWVRICLVNWCLGIVLEP